MNYDIWESHLTAEERNALLLLLPEVDREDQETIRRSINSNPMLHSTLREYQDFQKLGYFEGASFC